MMTVTQADNVIAKFKHLKETITRLYTNEKWEDLFKMACKVQINANLPFVAQLADKNFELTRNHMTTGIMACSKKS